ncbi:hypothetical protein ACFW9I_02590 [[Kitasatospora] papulosa]|uniref:hypothetical protein n=1 Tax=[Kitasatospora] papulosa TaxID=1464011 RepID=UPI0036994F0F
MTQQQRYVQRRQANHTLHIILTICTCGLWAITGWPIAAIMGRKTVTTVPTYVPPPGMYPQPTQQYPPQQQYQAPPYYGAQQPPPPHGQYGPPQQ